MAAFSKFADSLKTKYRERLLHREKQFPPVRGNKLISLELVKTEKSEGFQGQQKPGSQKVKRIPIHYSDLFKSFDGKTIRKVIAEAGAGMGKTMLCIQLAEEWAKGNALNQFPCVLLLPCREKKVAAAKSLPDLLKLLHSSERIRQDVAEELEDNEGEGVLIIIDGWDELEESQRCENSFLYELLFGDVLPLASVVLTSRPSASAQLHDLPHVDRFVEVMGFNKEKIQEYIESEFTDNPDKASLLLEQLDNNPLIASVCSVPLNCAITCYLWHTLEQVLPSTMTELYVIIILNVLLRNLKKKFPQHSNLMSLSNYDSIPPELQSYWWRICEFAFEAISRDQIVFSEGDLAAVFPEALDSDPQLQCFGLLQSAHSLLPVGHGLSFHFLHLTFQEHLAALHLLTLPVEKQFEICESHAGSSRFAMVWRFVFGLGCVKSAGSGGGEAVSERVVCLSDELVGKFLSILSDSKFNRLLCHCAFESKSVHISTKVAAQINGCFFSSIARTSHDCVAVCHVLSHTSSCPSLVIRMSGCSLDDKGLQGLVEPLSRAGGELLVKELHLENNKTTNKGVCDLFSRAAVAFKSLVYLHLKVNSIDGDGVSAIMRSLCFVTLSQLDLSDNRLGVSGYQALESAVLAGILAILGQLWLENTLTDDADVNGALLTTFASALFSHCRQLYGLVLSKNNLGVPGAQALDGAISQSNANTNLIYLDLNEIMLGDDGIVALAASVSGTCSIYELRIRNNNISANGASFLMDRVCSGSLRVRGLDLKNNPLGPAGATAVARKCSNDSCPVEYLYLNDLDPEEEKRLDEALKINRAVSCNCSQIRWCM